VTLKSDPLRQAEARVPERHAITCLSQDSSDTEPCRVPADSTNRVSSSLLRNRDLAIATTREFHFQYLDAAS